MKLIHTATTRPVSVISAVFLLALFGVLALYRVPVQLKPTIDQPEITVNTTFRGAAPQEVEQQVTDRIEEKLNSVENVKKITSTSQEGRSSITLEFDWGVNKDLASIDILKKLNLVEDLPEDADEPIISAISSDEAQPIMWMLIKGNLPVNTMRKYADDLIAPRLKRVAGVGDLRQFGGQEREIHVILDHRALNARGLSIAQVRDALSNENRNVRGGHVDEGKRRWAVRTVGQFSAVKEIENVIIAKNGGVPVYVKDVAEVIDSFEERDAVIKEHGVPTVGFGVIKKTGTNTLTVIEGVRRAVAELNQHLEPRGMQLQPVYDETEYIRDAIALVTQNLRFGAFLAVFVLLFFLHSLSSTLIIGFSIPISLIGTFIVVLAFRRTLNIISLAGLAFAVGMVVDNAIVVLENIYRHLQMGKNRMAAAYDGTSEVWGAVLASTLTTLAVFLPILFVEEEVGQLFQDLALAISAAVGLSLLVSITVIPMLCARFLRISASKLNVPPAAREGAASAGEATEPGASWWNRFGRRLGGRPAGGSGRSPKRFAGTRFLVDLALLGWLSRWVFWLIVESVRWLTRPVELERDETRRLLALAAASLAAGGLLSSLVSRGLGLYEWLALAPLSYLLLDTVLRLAHNRGAPTPSQGGARAASSPPAAPSEGAAELFDAPAGASPVAAASRDESEAPTAPHPLIGVLLLAALLIVLLLPLMVQPAADGWRFFWEPLAAPQPASGFGPPGHRPSSPAPSPWPTAQAWLLFIAPTLAAGLLAAARAGLPRALRRRGPTAPAPGEGTSTLTAADFGVHDATGGLPGRQATPLAYRTTLAATLQKVALLLLVTMGFVASIQVLPKSEYLPGGNRNFIFVVLKPFPGTNLDKLEELTDRVQDRLLGLPEVKYLFAVAGERFKGIGISAKREYEPQLKQLVAKVQGLTAGVPGFEFALALQSNIFSRDFGKSFDIEVRGKDLDVVADISERIKNRIMPPRGPLSGAPPVEAPAAEPEITPRPETVAGRAVPAARPAAGDGDGQAGRARDGRREVRPGPPGGDGGAFASPPASGQGVEGVTFVRTSYETGNPEVQVKVDRERAADLGLSVREVADVVETLVAGRVATEYREGGDKIDVRVKGTRGVYHDTAALSDLIVYTPNGMQVKLSSIAQLEKTTGPTKIDHIELDRAVRLTVNVAENAPLGQVIEAVTNEVLEPLRRTLPQGYSFTLAGSADKLQVAIREVSWSLVFAVLIIFLLMASLFESFLYPLIIIITVPLAASGAILAVRLTHSEYTMITRLGFILLSGIVVNTAILLVHQTLNFMRNEGMEPYEALIEGTRSRIRPIFMTTITSVLGMLPLAAGNEFGLAMQRLAGALHIEPVVGALGLLPESASSAGAELYSGLGAAVVGGLTVSTLLTLVLVPVLFALFLDLRTSLRRPRRR
ncbi:MAG: efflux RND transporter permease subunit [Candidatus Tectomicrobia bacterium]|nr:efflux RND transporter permease subunit [Candidatus Tectomicrobia bacterium]